LSGSLELENLSEEGVAPKSRLPDAVTARGILTQLINDDFVASIKRAEIQGMIDGNAPFTDSDLKKSGQLNIQPNMNWGGAEARVVDALTPHFDLLTSVPTFAVVETEYGDDEKNTEWSQIITEEFDRALREWRGFMFQMQLHQSQMVIHGVGPIFWRDEHDWRFKALKRRNILVPRDSASDVDELETVFIRDHMRVHELWEHIENESAATAAGWDVESAKDAIRNAANDAQDRLRTWEWFQEKLKDNAYAWSISFSKIIMTSHAFVREFDGSVSHHLFTEEATATEGRRKPTGNTGGNYLFSDVSVYEDMGNAVCVFFDGVGNGDFESVRGLGNKVFKFGQAQNRMNNALVMNATVGACIMWQGDPNAISKAQAIEFGPHRFMPAGLTQVQVNTGPAIQATLQVASHFQQLEMSTTGSYTTQAISSNSKERTAEEVRAEVGEKSQLTNSKVSHYLMQWDGGLTETYRRISSSKYLSSDPGYKSAKAFKDRCLERGVPKEAIEKVCRVYASRPIGNGSPADRMMKYDRLTPFVERMPPRSQQLFFRDKAAAETGSNRLALKYFPDNPPPPTWDESLAALENSAMQQGDQVVFSPEQNSAMHLPIHVAFGYKLANDVQTGETKPHDAAKAFQLLGPHMVAHLQQLKKDPTQQATFNKLNQQVSELMKIADQIEAAAQQQQPAQQPPDSETMKAQADIARADAVAKADIKRKDDLAAATMKRHDAQTAQHLALTAVKTQQGIQHANVKTGQDLAINQAEHEQQLEHAQETGAE
jgi:hypothetical protein